MRPPRCILAPAVLGLALIVVPLIALCTRVDLAGLPGLLASRASLDALWLSLRTSAAATALCVVVGIPLALVLARADLPGRRVLRTLVLLPLVLPPVVGGIALLSAFGRQGLLGAAFEAAGVRIAFSTLAVVLAQAFVSLPFLVVTVEGALTAADDRHELVAATLGASPSRVLATITLPAIAPGLGAGTVLAFARSLGEFGATLTFAGSLQGVTRTLPLEIYLQRESDPRAAVALSLVLIAVAAVIVAVTHRPPRRSR